MRYRWSAVVILFLSSWFIISIDASWTALWPSVVALAAVFLLNRTITGLLLGAAAGLLLLNGGNPVSAFVSFFPEHLFPVLGSSWNLSVLAFTLLLGGFAALLEKGGGIQALMQKGLNSGGHSGRKVQWSAYTLGLICFFDGLANSMLVGKSMSPMAENAGVSKQRMAYIVDSTSSAVACVAVISTWIAYQLSMIKEGLLLAGVDAQPFGLFLKSIPFNFYCWFTLILLAVVISNDWNIGPMRQTESQQENENGQKEAHDCDEKKQSAQRHNARSASCAVFPLGFLILGLLIGLYLNGLMAFIFPFL
ncbi:Na+/H+ antiporter NhaC family protein [Pontiellaceae bacterium B12219]|nr:Na+/H+ antiporter NhaC family protein [Pontiellaceae bacterium B12219]